MVAELFPTETTEAADVVLPATSFAEKSGTVTNTCGQVQILKKTMRKAGTRSDLEILLALARLLGHTWNYRSSDDVLREIIARVPGYAIALPSLLVGRAVPTQPAGTPPGACQQRSGFFIARFALHIGNGEPVQLGAEFSGRSQETPWAHFLTRPFSSLSRLREDCSGPR